MQCSTLCHLYEAGSIVRDDYFMIRLHTRKVAQKFYFKKMFRDLYCKAQLNLYYKGKNSHEEIMIEKKSIRD